MMEIVVKIPDDMIKSLEQGNFGAKYNIYDLVGCLMNGTPLPEKTTERYKPIILQEHDAEPRRLKAILDTETNDIYILETTRGFAEHMGMIIEEVNADEKE